MIGELMKPGNRKTWTPEREAALLSVGKKAEEIGSKKKKDWTSALQMCKKENRILKVFTVEQLRKSYKVILKSTKGYMRS